MKNTTPIVAVNSAENKDFIIEQIDNCAKAVQALLENVSEEQFIYKPSPNEWSLSECLEHITLFDKLIFGTVQKLSEAPRDTMPTGVPPKEKIMHLMTKRAYKVKAPEFCIPTGKYTDKVVLIEFFLKQHQAVKDFVNNTPIDLKKIAFKHFVIGLIDAIGWLSMIGGHGQRHILQMKEIMASDDFPA